MSVCCVHALEWIPVWGKLRPASNSQYSGPPMLPLGSGQLVEGSGWGGGARALVVLCCMLSAELTAFLPAKGFQVVTATCTSQLGPSDLFFCMIFSLLWGRSRSRRCSLITPSVGNVQIKVQGLADGSALLDLLEEMALSQAPIWVKTAPKLKTYPRNHHISMAPLGVSSVCVT